jgi:hypothetical protein
VKKKRPRRWAEGALKTPTLIPEAIRAECVGVSFLGLGLHLNGLRFA